MNLTITTLEKYGLGLVRDGSVILRLHNPLWDEAARFEIDRLNIGIGCTGFSFYHIGSTSISTICAKPILDLLILVPSLAEIDQYKESFEALGYEYKSEYGIPGRRYCVLYNEEKTKSYVHIHAFQVGHIEADRHLLFRDYLRAAPEVAKLYQKLKLNLLSDVNVKRSVYTEAKAVFIKKVLFEAEKWRKSSPII